MLTTTTTTTTTNPNTTTNTQNDNNTAQQQQQMRDRWEKRVTGALFRKLKREVHAAHDALIRAPSGWVAPDLVSMWFMPQLAEDVTRHAALAEECLDDVRAHAKRKGRSLPPLEYLPSGILESEALEPYLKRWKRDIAAAAAAAAAAPTRARCAYHLMD
jgi:hypothetical protein